MHITRFSIHRPLAMLMILLAIVIMGAVAYTQLPVRHLPNVNFPHITVILSDPGASPDTMRKQIVDPVENALTKVNGIVTMTAVARNGSGTIGLRFPGGTNIDTVASDVSRVVNQMAGQLPVGTGTPTILKADPNALPIMDVAVYGTLSQTSLYDLVSQTIEPALSTEPGVATINLIGGHPSQVNVVAHAALLEQDGLSLATLRAAIAGQNTSQPAGTSDQGALTYPVQVSGNVSSLPALESLQLPDHVTLGEIASVTQGTAPVTTVSHLNGQTAIGLVISAQSTANSLQTATDLKEKIQELQSQMPVGVHMVVTGNTTTYTSQAMTATQSDLFLAILAAAIMISLWLHRLRLTFVIVLAIPTTLFATFLFMYFMHFSLDMMSLMALSLLIGILVDDAIVVLENIVRHHRLGQQAKEAAWIGRMEISGAAIAITLTDVVVYTPVAFMQGNIGQLFREFGLTIVFASLFSLFVSFTLTPLLAAHIGLREPRKHIGVHFEHQFEAWFERVSDGYEKGVRFAFRRFYLILGVVLVAFSFNVMAFRTGLVATTYTPAQNASVFFVNVQMPSGTNVETTDGAVSQLSEEIQKIPGIQSVLSTTGFGAGSATSSNIGRLTVDMKSGGSVPSVFVVLPEIQTMAKKIPGMKIQTNVPNALVSGSGGSLSVVLRGSNILTLDALSTQVETLFQKIPGIKNITSTAQNTVPEESIQVNAQAAAAYGLSTRSVGQAIHMALQGMTVSQYRPSTTSMSEPIVLQLQTGDITSGQSALGGQGMSLATLLQLPVGTVGGQTITLQQVATVQATQSPAFEREYDRQLEVQVSANTGGQPLGTIAQEAKVALHKLSVPSGYSYGFTGAIRQQGRAFGPLLQALWLSILLIYMLLAALYESFIDPFAMVLTLPLALTGAILALWMTNTPFSMYAFIAVVMLTGLVAKNAILLVDYAKRSVRSGELTLQEALIRAGRIRLRPILMTTGTMVLAMLPLALPVGAGASERMPMALVLIGGMITSTWLTLFVLPVVYLLLDRVKVVINQIFHLKIS